MMLWLWWFLWWFIWCVGFVRPQAPQAAAGSWWLGIVGCTIGWQKTTAPPHALFWEQTNPLITMFLAPCLFYVKGTHRVFWQTKNNEKPYTLYIYSTYNLYIYTRWHNMISPMSSIRLRLHLWLHAPALPLTGPASSPSTQIELAWGETLMRSCRQRFRDGYILHYYHETIFAVSQYREFPSRRM